MADPDGIRGRAMRALATVVAVALGVGVILAVGAYAAARMAGLTDGGGPGNGRPVSAAGSPTPSATAPETPASTAGSPATARQHRAGARQTAQRARADRSHAAQPRPQQHSRSMVRRHRHRQRHQEQRRHRRRAVSGVVTLHASQTRVQPMGRVDLGGRCGCGGGTRLVVQRREHNQWSRFPASATVFRGRFHTWVMTGRHGPNEFRVVVPGGRASNPVTITVI